MYECMERMLKGDAKAEFLQKANLLGCHTVATFIVVMATMTVHVFPSYAYCDAKAEFFSEGEPSRLSYSRHFYFGNGNYGCTHLPYLRLL